jgi:UDP-3-O-[3-hydroxymyristoyl] glucosamine N-acyltransferase
MNWQQLLEVDGDLKLQYPAQCELSFSGLSDVDGVRDGHLFFAKDRTYLERLEKADGKEQGLILEQKLFDKLEESEIEGLKSKWAALIATPDVLFTMTKLSKAFYALWGQKFNDEVDGRQMGTTDIHPTCKISQHVFIGKGVTIGEGCKIHSGVRILSGTKVGKNCEIFPNATLYQNTEVGDNVIIHGGATIGADGFGFHFKDGIHHKIWHMGNVCLGNEVEVGANSCVDRGTFGTTVIGEGSKLDNHVQIGHNCRLGRGVVICGHVAIGGSSTLGDYTVFGGKSGMGHNMHLGAGCQVGGGALVNCDWPNGSILGGHPARPLKEWMRGLAYVRKESLKKPKK